MAVTDIYLPSLDWKEPTDASDGTPYLDCICKMKKVSARTDMGAIIP